MSLHLMQKKSKNLSRGKKFCEIFVMQKFIAKFLQSKRYIRNISWSNSTFIFTNFGFWGRFFTIFLFLFRDFKRRLNTLKLNMFFICVVKRPYRTPVSVSYPVRKAIIILILISAKDYPKNQVHLDLQKLW